MGFLFHFVRCVTKNCESFRHICGCLWFFGFLKLFFFLFCFISRKNWNGGFSSQPQDMVRWY